MQRFVLSTMSVLLLAGVAPQTSRGASAPRATAPEEIIAHMERRSAQQLQALESYQDRRRYVAEHAMLSQPAFWVVEEDFRAPQQKELRVLERSGPAFLERQLFSRLLSAELEAARGTARLATELCRRNYRFTFREYDAAREAYVFDVQPLSESPYLLRGTVWVNREDYGVMRIEGEPAQSQSFWVRQSHFVHEFARFGEFWFPVRNRSEAELRMFGRATLEINYYDYRWQTRQKEGL